MKLNKFYRRILEHLRGIRPLSFVAVLVIKNPKIIIK
jgi:hypothetical protein